MVRRKEGITPSGAGETAHTGKAMPCTGETVSAARHLVSFGLRTAEEGSSQKVKNREPVISHSQVCLASHISPFGNPNFYGNIPVCISGMPVKGTSISSGVSAQKNMYLHTH